MLCSNCQGPVDNRTLKQNNSIHLYYQLLAEALNDAGYDMKAVIRQEIDIPWTAYNVKEFLWRPIQKMITGEHSTTRLKKKDIDKIYDTLNRVIGERTGVYVEFPSIDNLILSEKV